ncbi:PREDICTED: serine/threonine-protein phosphatase 7 long form homolog [Camelina sativa]|uniref:Serine/threonine-protein phosphatase 7 long form homolog n=1 Tax=Camelina sativa TaxID=90675 RepID=A0ABM1QX23_CAMSA|nr:PREDICTED: serine/threonine-protein phosphatase 7 long form homolog [Camelina sativa]
MSSQHNDNDMLDEVQEPSSDVGKRSTYSALARRSSREKTQLLKPCLTTSVEGSEAMGPSQSGSAPCSQSKALSMGVSFYGWRFANEDFKLWVKKMSDVHEHTWRKAWIFEAIMASTVRIPKDVDLVLAIAEKWCPETKTFLFPWGEASITLEDVMVLLGFSVLGLPVFATLDSSGEMVMEKLNSEWLAIKRKGHVSIVTQVTWTERFMNRDDEYEHVAFLVLWLSYFVLPSRYPHVCQEVFPIAIHLSRGTRIALATAVLAHLYADLSLLKNYITDFKESTTTLKIGLTALFKLVQVWTWERFRELQPKPNQMQKGEPRLAR